MKRGHCLFPQIRIIEWRFFVVITIDMQFITFYLTLFEVTVIVNIYLFGSVIYSKQ